MNTLNKTKFITLIITLATIIAIITATLTFGTSAKGESGSQNNMAVSSGIEGYEIDSQADLVNFANSTTDTIGVLVANFTVDMSNSTGLKLAKDKSIYGNGYTITVSKVSQSLTIEQASNIDGTDVYPNEIVGKTASGGLFAINEGNLNGLKIILNTDFATNSIANFIGGIAGFNSISSSIMDVTTTIKSCTTYPNNVPYVGGIAGYNYGSISNCEAIIDSFENDIDIYFGGIAGGNASKISNTTVEFSNLISLTGKQAKFGGVAGKNDTAGLIYYTTINSTRKLNFNTASAQCVANNGGIINGILIDDQTSTPRQNYKVVGSSSVNNVRNIYIITSNSRTVQWDELGVYGLFSKQIITNGESDVKFNYMPVSAVDVATSVSYNLEVKLKDSSSRMGKTLYGLRPLWYNHPLELSETKYENRNDTEKANDLKYNLNTDSVNNINNFESGSTGPKKNANFVKTVNNDAYNIYYKYQIITATLTKLNTPSYNNRYNYSDTIMLDAFTSKLTLNTNNSYIKLNKGDLALYGMRDGKESKLDTPGTFTNISVANEKHGYANVLDCTDFSEIYNDKTLGGEHWSDVFVVDKENARTILATKTISINNIELAGNFDMTIYERSVKRPILTGNNAKYVYKYKISSKNGAERIISKDDKKYSSLFKNNSIDFDTDILEIESTDSNGVTYYVTALDKSGKEISTTTRLKLFIDNEKPTLNLISDISEKIWYNSSKNLEFSVYDRQSSIDNMKVSYCISDTNDYTDAKWNSLTASGDKFEFSLVNGIKYYFIKVEDTVGNFNIYSYNLKMDNVIPNYIVQLKDGGSLPESVAVNEKLRIKFSDGDMTQERLDETKSYILFKSGNKELKLTIASADLKTQGQYMYYEFSLPFTGNVKFDINIITRSGNENKSTNSIAVTKTSVTIYYGTYEKDLIIPVKSKLTKKYDGSNVFESYDGDKYLNETGIKWSDSFATDYPGLKFNVTFPDAKAVDVAQNLKFEINDDRYAIKFAQGALENINKALADAVIKSIKLKLVLSENNNYKYSYTGEAIQINSDEFKYSFIDAEDSYVNYNYLIPELSGAISIGLATPTIVDAGQSSKLNFVIDINKLKNTIAYDKSTNKYFIQIVGLNTAGETGTVDAKKDIVITKKDLDVSIDFNSIQYIYTGEKQELKLRANNLSSYELEQVEIKYTKNSNSVDGLLDVGVYYVSLQCNDGNYNVPSDRTEIDLRKKQIQANINKVSENTQSSAIEIEYTGEVAVLEIDFAVSDAILDREFGKGSITKIVIRLNNEEVAYKYDAETKRYLIDFSKLNVSMQPINIAQYTIDVSIANTNNISGLQKQIIFKIVPTTHNTLTYDLNFVYDGTSHKLNVTGYPKTIKHVCYFSKQDWDGKNEHVCNCEYEGKNGKGKGIVTVNGNPEILFVVVDWAGNPDNDIKPPYEHMAAGKYEYKINFYNFYFSDTGSLNRRLIIESANATELYFEISDKLDAQYNFDQKPEFKLDNPDAVKINEYSNLTISAIYYWKPIENVNLVDKPSTEEEFFNKEIANMRKYADREKAFTDAKPDKVYQEDFDKQYTDAGIYVYRYLATGASIAKNETYFTKVLKVKRAVLDKAELSVDSLTKVFDGKALNMDDIDGHTFWGKFARDNDEAEVIPSFMAVGEEIIDADPENPYDVVYTFKSLNYENMSVTQAFTILPKPVKVEVETMKNEIRIKSNMKKMQEMLDFVASFDDPTLPVDEDGEKETVEVSLNFDEVDTSKAGVYKVTLQLDNENYIATNDPIEITLLKEISITTIIVVIACILAVLALGTLSVKIYMKKYQIKL